MKPRRARFSPSGILALHPEAWGLDFLIFGGAEESPPFEMVGTAAVVDVGRGGPLVQHEDWCWDSYESIGARARAAFESDAERVILRIDSPGGDVAGCFDLSRELMALSASTGKPYIAYTPATCASAAYAIACGATEVVASDTSLVGSVGCIGVTEDRTAFMGMMGIKLTVFTSGERKVDGHPDVPLDDAGKANLQARIESLCAVFFDVVSSERQMSVEDLAALRGNVFVGADAVRVGLVDRIATWGELIAGLSGAENAMPLQTKASKYDEAVGAMKRAAEGDDEDSKKAKKALKAIEDDDKPADDKPADDKSKAAEDEKKKDEEAKAAASKAEDEKKKDEEAKAMAAGSSFALAREVQELKAKDAARDAADAKAKEAQARTTLLAKRPDFSPAVRATLEAGPLALLEDAVKTWPRVTAAPQSSVNALTPEVGGGESTAGYQPKLSADEQAILAKLDRTAPAETRATQRGTSFEMPMSITKEAAAARAAELEAQLKKGGV